MKTVNKNSINFKIVKETMDFNSGTNKVIDNIYNFSVEHLRTPSDNSVYFTSTYNNSDDYLSGFYLYPMDAIQLGLSLINMATDCMQDQEYNDNLIYCYNKLLDDIKSGIVEKLIVKYKKKTCVSCDNMFDHVYNIYPIYIDGIKNNHFNFNMVLNITNFALEQDPKKIVRTIFHLDEYLYDEDELGLTDEEKAVYYKIKSKNPHIFKTNRRIKVKFVNCRKIFKEDKEACINLMNTFNKDNCSDKQIREFENRKKRQVQLRDIITTTPKRPDGTIDFNKIMQQYNPNFGE